MTDSNTQEMVSRVGLVLAIPSYLPSIQRVTDGGSVQGVQITPSNGTTAVRGLLGGVPMRFLAAILLAWSAAGAIFQLTGQQSYLEQWQSFLLLLIAAGCLASVCWLLVGGAA